MMKTVKATLNRWRQKIPGSLTRGWSNPTPPHPKGKLGTIIKHFEENRAVSLDELIILTDWQKPTVHAALSRLRARGFAIEQRKQNGRAHYGLKGMDGNHGQPKAKITFT